MDIRQCERCNTLFQFMGNFKCPACVNELDKIFINVRNYLDEHPSASIEDVCDICEVDEEEVLGWLREGRLLLSSDSIARLTCQGCHMPIQSGRYCEDCASQVVDQLEETAQHFSSGAVAGGRASGRLSQQEKRIHVRIMKD